MVIQLQENKDKKREDESVRKQEARRLLEEEEESLKTSAKMPKPSKLTRAQIQAEQEIRAAQEGKDVN